ncbi:methylated-DNA--[protein]-cysteine S-methyltransferase [Desulforamulus putei]|nr:methylated-DNA--[protein]-cysteine S-methyltransferase [Desulforamulus putei]
MNLQLVHTPWGCSAAAWEKGLLAGVTLPHDNEKEAIGTLAGYLKIRQDRLINEVLEKTDELQQRLAEGLVDYFAGKPVAFDLPLLWSRLTPFQQRVLKVVKEIPYGQVISYGEIARQIGCPGGARAVGGAVGSNPWLLVVPCHRVLAGNRQLGGFSSGLTWKEKLLKLENIPYKTSHG